MPISTKALITGVDLEDPKEFSDFNDQQRAAFLLRLYQLSTVLREASQLLKLQTEVASLRVVQEENPNLFTQAALYYGDVRSWGSIASLSELRLPVLTGSYDLKVPPQAGLARSTIA